jgi:hypothetical protein
MKGVPDCIANIVCCRVWHQSCFQCSHGRSIFAHGQGGPSRSVDGRRRGWCSVQFWEIQRMDCSIAAGLAVVDIVVAICKATHNLYDKKLID